MEAHVRRRVIINTDAKNEADDQPEPPRAEG